MPVRADARWLCRAVLLVLLFGLACCLVAFAAIGVFGDLERMRWLNLFLAAFCADEPAVLDSRDFAWSEALRDNWRTVRDEYRAFERDHDLPEHADISAATAACVRRGTWRTVFLRVFGTDTALAEFFPETMALIAGTPCTLAYFSVLAPGTVLAPHVGVYKGVLRYHLALAVPTDNPERCYLEIDGGRLFWEEGDDLMFDDMFLHSARNESTEERVVLFMDIRRRFANPLVDLLNSVFLRYVRSNDVLTSTVARANAYDYAAATTRLREKRRALFPREIEDFPATNDDKARALLAVPGLAQESPETVEFVTRYKAFVRDGAMLSMARRPEIDMMADIVRAVVREGIAGAVVEAGVWRGGMSIWMRVLFEHYGSPRATWCFDAFGEFPAATQPLDKKTEPAVRYLFAEPADLPAVLRAFSEFDVLDAAVTFVQGDFAETMPATPLPAVAVLRIDGDYYESTLVPLRQYYANVVPGGFVVVDDYGNEFLECKRAVDEFRAERGMREPLQAVANSAAVYWRKESGP